jgi:hypothetical protein
MTNKKCEWFGGYCLNNKNFKFYAFIDKIKSSYHVNIVCENCITNANHHRYLIHELSEKEYYAYKII